MPRAVLLDATPLSLLAAPLSRADAQACLAWAGGLLAAGNRVIIPEIIDYEVRRELLRAGKKASLRRLDALAQLHEYLPLTTSAMRRAAELWALARQRGQPTAGDSTIDADMILAAQALTLLNAPAVVIATNNVAHLSRFVAAELWPNIIP